MINDNDSSKIDDDFNLKERCEKSEGCICNMLEDIVEAQKEARNRQYNNTCSLGDNSQRPIHNTIPILLQTPYGHPYFTWGKVGTEDCFVTVFFSVVRVDRKENCAILRLLKPNGSLIDLETNTVEPALICDVNFVIETKECVLVDLSSFSALKCLSLDFVKKTI